MEQNILRISSLIIITSLRIGWGGSYDYILNSIKVVQRLREEVILNKLPTFPTKTLFITFKISIQKPRLSKSVNKIALKI